MKGKLLYKIFIIGFVLLYVATALISLVHAIGFFKIGNIAWMSYTLAGVFELGQMVVLSSLLLSNNKKTLIPWILLIVLTTVQVIGNVFSVYKYIAESGTNDYIYLQQSLIDWWLSGVSQQTIIVIISWIMGALLPIIALFMTAMVSNNIKLMQQTQEPKAEQTTDNHVEENVPEQIVEEKTEPVKKEKPVEVVEAPKKKDTVWGKDTLTSLTAMK